MSAISNLSFSLHRRRQTCIQTHLILSRPYASFHVVSTVPIVGICGFVWADRALKEVAVNIYIASRHRRWRPLEIVQVSAVRATLQELRSNMRVVPHATVRVRRARTRTPQQRTAASRGVLPTLSTTPCPVLFPSCPALCAPCLVGRASPASRQRRHIMRTTLCAPHTTHCVSRTAFRPTILTGRAPSLQ